MCCVQDLSSQNMYDAGVALNGLACFVSPDLARDLANDIMTLVCLYVCLFGGKQEITYWSQGVAYLPHKCQPPLSSARQHPSYGDCLEVGNIIRTALCWVVWHNVHSQQHTHVSSSYRSSRLGLSHWDSYAVRRGGCLELYYCNMVEWCW